jgi:hypothetical protein
MKNRISLFFFTALIGVFGFFALFEQMRSRVCDIRYISYSFDPHLSAQVRSAIEKQVSLLECEGTYQVSALMRELSRIFPEIEQIDIRSFPHNLAELSISAPRPVASINHSHVLTDKQLIIPSSYYAQYVLERLPHIRASELLSESVSNEVMAAIEASIKEHIFERFSVTIESEQLWRLQDNADPLLTICCNASCLPIGGMKHLHSQIKALVKQKGATQTAWMADVRFSHQIVLSRYKGGRNGKRI